MQKIKSLVHNEPKEPDKSVSPVKRMQSRRRSDAILGGQGSHLADLRSSWASEKVQPRYSDEEAAFSTGPSSPEPPRRRIDSGVAGLEGPQQESKKLVNGRPTGATVGGTSGYVQPSRRVSVRDSSLRAQDKSPVSMSGGISTRPRQQLGVGQVGVPDEMEAAASAAASAYFRRKPNAPMEMIRPGKAVHSLNKSKEPPPLSVWGKGREYRPLAHDPLAGVPRRDSSTLGFYASPGSTPSTARKAVPQSTAQPVPRATETSQPEQTEYKPEGYPEMMEKGDQEEYQRQYERPLSEGAELYPEAPIQERQYERPISEGQEMLPEAPIQERQYERPINEGPDMAPEAPMLPTAVRTPQLTYISQYDHEYITVEDITAHEEATRRAVMEEAMARRKAAEEVAAREAVTREAIARETVARETAREEFAAMEEATREAYDKEAVTRQSAVAELAALEEATRQAVAREEAARDAAAASIQSTEAATREAVAREALTKQAVAERIATREVVTREAISREAVAREVGNRDAAIKQANTREVAAEEVAVREAALREGGFDEAIARDAALREVAAQEAVTMRAEEPFMPQEPAAIEILVREPGPGSLAAGGAFAEELPPEQMTTGGAAPFTQPVGAGVLAPPIAEPVNQGSYTEQESGAQAMEPRQGRVEPEGGRPSKEGKELEKQRTKEENALRKQRTKQEKRLDKERAKEEKARQKQLRKEEKEVQKQHDIANKQLKKSQERQEREAKRREEEMRTRSEISDQGQRESGFLGKIRRASRSIGLERPNGYGMDRTIPNGAPAIQSGRL
ncbi:hypothetical protein EMCG_06105 [[Emmonsia] crescens]|uniref:Uncharacterized protein n=1 Tax=[Emmonsia] crescens TaxID=73230 RepID=A0A0G2J758_9EURO|nr:hypothetical protein EMCG_06105 [Emmonsia crescens UAMH 3008]